MAWLLGQSNDLDTALEAQLLAGILLDNSASPLLHALETSSLGSSPSPMCGLEDSMREMVFACGLEGSDPEQMTAVEDLILSTLQRLIDEGVDAGQVESVLHQIELQQREISGDSYPYGLQLILNALGSATHRGDPVSALNLDPALARLRQKIAQPSYITGLLQQLIDNPHRVTLIFSPDAQYQQRAEQAEKQRLADIKAGLSDEQKQAIIEQAAALETRQTQQEDESILPKVGLEDVAPDMPVLDYRDDRFGNLPYTFYPSGTNGLIYQQLLIELPLLDEAELSLLPIYTQTLTELGLGNESYLQVQARQAAVCGGISAYTSMRGDIGDEQQMKAFLVLSSKALLRNSSEQAQLMRDTLEKLRFDEVERITDIVAHIRARRESSITGNGHGLAMAAACGGMSPIAELNQKLAGLQGIRALKAIDDSLKSEEGKQGVGQQLTALHQKLLAAQRRLLIVAEQHGFDEHSPGLAAIWADFQASSQAPLQLATVRGQRREFWCANSQVNFCASAYPTVPSDHPDAPALSVLAVYLRNGILHRCIREQGGAYGGGASQDSNIAAFRFYSYRDPRLQETLDDFRSAINWMLETPVSEDALEQSILGVVGSIDRPGSPAGEAKQDYHNRIFGRNLEDRRRFRQRVLAVSGDDLKRVTKQYLEGVEPSIAVLSNASRAEQLEEWLRDGGFSIQKL